MVVDVDVALRRENPINNFFHFLATNIPGNDVSKGEVNFEYIPPFTFLFTPEQGLVRDGNFGHRMVVLVFEQRDRVNYRKEENWCSSEVFGRLVVSAVVGVN